MKRMTRRESVFAALLLAVTTMPLAQAHEHGKKKRQPPPAAFEACAEQVEGAICVFPGRDDDQISGTCTLPPDDSQVLACKPDRPPRDREQPPEDSEE